MSNVPPVARRNAKDSWPHFAAGQAFDFTDGTTTLEGIVLLRSKPESNQVDASDLIAIESKNGISLAIQKTFETLTEISLNRQAVV